MLINLKIKVARRTLLTEEEVHIASRRLRSAVERVVSTGYRILRYSTYRVRADDRKVYSNCLPRFEAIWAFRTGKSEITFRSHNPKVKEFIWAQNKEKYKPFFAMIIQAEEGKTFVQIVIAYVTMTRMLVVSLTVRKINIFPFLRVNL